MINKTIQKIKETADAIASIMKSFAAIIGSTIACITVAITGYIEIKKLTAQALITRAETKKVKEKLRDGVTATAPAPKTTTSEIVGTAPEYESSYKVDYNTGILAIALAVLPVIWYMGKKKKEEKKS